jgi:hypothetical protein
MLRIPLVAAASLAALALAQPRTTIGSDAPPASTTPAKAAPAAPPDSQDVDPEFARISQGWKPTQRGETTIYCRYETRLGTRVGKNVCLTRQQLLDRAQAGQEVRDRMAKPNQCAGPCTTGG